MTSSLVGSEMCIRDSSKNGSGSSGTSSACSTMGSSSSRLTTSAMRRIVAVSYTHLTLPTICSV
eukprot:389641-Prorocentrum_lima.AAC.1